LENIGADGKTFWTGPDIESFGTNPKLNDLFIGSKGMLGIPLNIKVKL
jgi:FAD/FMN-containing dehydrogenase